ncbi:spermine oxidase-like isoform X1 [Bacillus rossius redtenbacheri]|uniref:spermine oxidase-like isoform X1 n=1 Tax=Bacillus rossius redtenbacheri TaxID=93214 RepID=UPI002FDE6B07
MSTRTRVLIVGAGAAGIAAACRLAERGVHDFLILEAEDRVGGRICTKTFGGVVTDFGCQWVHGEKGNVVYELAGPLGLLEDSCVRLDHSLAFSAGSGLVDWATAQLFLGTLADIAAECAPGLSVAPGPAGDFFLQEYSRRLKAAGIDTDDSTLARAFFRWSRQTQDFQEGPESSNQPSGPGCLEHRDCAGNFWLRWKQGGYHTVIDLLTKRFPDASAELPVRSKVCLNKEVTSVQWEGQHQVVTSCADGSVYLSDHVLVTVSLGVLKDKCQTLFQPQLPAYKLTAIQGLDMGTLDKIFLKFSYQWWPNEVKGFGILWTEEALEKLQIDKGDGSRAWLQGVFGFHPTDNAPTTLMGWVGGQFARQMESLPLPAVLHGCTELLQFFFGQLYDIPRAEQIDRSAWRLNPHFLGSGSFRSVRSEAVGATAALLARPLHDSLGRQVVLFAGEATHDHYYGSVHGAVETGFREADRLANLLA